MTLLSIVQDAADLIGIARPTVVVGSSDQQVRELLALAQEEGKDLASRFDWQRLTKEFTFTTTATPEQAAAIPEDWDRWLPNTQFDRTTRRNMLGPITAQEWQSIQAQPQLNRVYLAYRVRDNAYLLTPTPTAGDTVAGEYVSKYWVQAQDGSYKARFSADDDVSLLDEWQMTLGLRWRFRKSKSLDYAEDFNTYERQAEQLMARDQGSTMLNTTGKSYYVMRPNIPEGNWPGP